MIPLLPVGPLAPHSPTMVRPVELRRLAPCRGQALGGSVPHWPELIYRTNLQGLLGSLTLFLPARDDDDVTAPWGAGVSLPGVSCLPGIIAILLDRWLHAVNWGQRRGAVQP